jgi:histidyl-tRNA synthetase
MQRPRGTRDLWGEELAGIRHVMQAMREVFERFGYQEVETPIFEHLELFTKRSGTNVVKQLYAFKDRSSRDIALRPELTAPAVRLYIQQLRSEPKPLKLCYFGNCFRYEEPQAQRWRQFLQAGVEVIGSPRPETDAEVVTLADNVMRGLGFEEFELRVGHIRLLRELLAHAGVSGDAQDPILRAIDSREEQRIRDEFKHAGVSDEDEKVLRGLIGLRGGTEVIGKAEALLKGIHRTASALKNLKEVIEYLGSLGVRKFVVDFGIARGLDYYTDFVFELYVDGVQVAGGGRYDTLIEILGGDPTPAVGVGFGVDRIAQTLLKRGMIIPGDRLDCMVLPADEKVLDECLKIATELRGAGFSVDVDLMGRRLSKALAYANALKVKRVVVVGAKDLSKGQVSFRDMLSGKQELVARDEVIKKLESVA